MRRQALIIGLGQFGMSLARSLAERGVSVIAVDEDPKRTAQASDFAEVLEFDATDREALERVSPQKRDLCVCALGETSREASILCTALLQELGAKEIVARASDHLHARILSAVGAKQVINPEQEAGDQAVFRLMGHDVQSTMMLGHGFYLLSLEAPDSFIGMTLAQLSLPRRFGVNVVTIRGQANPLMELPTATRTIVSGDVLLLAGTSKALDALLKKS